MEPYKFAVMFMNIWPKTRCT